MIAVLLAVLLVVLAVRAVSVWRDRRSTEQWAFLLAIAGVVVTLLLEVPRVQPDLVPGVDPRLARLGQNLAIVAAFAALQLFYLRHVSRFLRRPRLVVELVVVAAVAAVLVASTVRVVAEGGDLGSGTATLRRPAVAAFYLAGGGYILYAVGTQLWWTARFARRRDAVEPLVRRAATGAAAGSLLILAGEAVRCAAVLAVLVTGRSPGDLERPSLALILAGSLVLVIALGLPALVVQGRAALRWWRMWRAHRGLAPLWREVARACPELVRPPRPADGPGAARRIRRTPVAVALHHRLGQCREGYLRAVAGDGAPPDPRLAALAERLRACPPVPVDAGADGGAIGPVASPDGLPADAHAFLAVARALARTPPGTRAAPVSGDPGGARPRGRT
jgi:hypothetical protein